MNPAATRAKALRDQAHSLYLKADEFRAAAYALEQEALGLLCPKRVMLVMPVISPMPETIGIDEQKPCSRCAERVRM